MNIQTYSRLSALINGEDLSAGSVESPVSVSVTGLPYRLDQSIANSANAVMYSNALAGFSYLYLVSDFDLRLVITNNASASFSLTIKGTGKSGQYGVPFVLASDDTTSSSVIINSLQVFNTSGSTALCKCIIIQ